MSAPAKSHSGGRQIAEESGVAVGCRLQAQRRRDNGALGRWRQVVGSQGYAPYLFSRSPSFISYPPPSFSIFLARSPALSCSPQHTYTKAPPALDFACVRCLHWFLCSPPHGSRHAGRSLDLVWPEARRPHVAVGRRHVRAAGLLRQRSMIIPPASASASASACVLLLRAYTH